MLTFDIRQVPFSRYGSYLAFSHVAPSDGATPCACLRTVHGDAPRREVFALSLLHHGQPIPYEETATPSLLTLTSAAGRVEICIAEEKLVRVRCLGVSLQLAYTTPWAHILPREHREWTVNCGGHRLQFQFIPLGGSLTASQGDGHQSHNNILVQVHPDPETGVAECAIGEFRSIWQHSGDFPPFDACVRAAEEEFAQWQQLMPDTPAYLAEATALAAYINWSAVVSPEGCLQRPGMLMSKNWMTNVWSWDHCFNAMALSYKHPQAAWDQLLVMFDAQDEFGALPDTLNDAGMLWNYCKPPVHGWTLRWLMTHGTVTQEQLAAFYPQLSRWTEYWFRYRDDDGDGVPQYNHGNDSGWDNSTLFLGGVPVEGPDLCAFLTVQMDVLAEVAEQLGRADEAARWRERAAEMLQKLLQHCWRGDRFVAPRSGRHNAFESDSLVAYIPIFLGMRLPAEVCALLVAGLKEPDAFLTAHGLATERIFSPFYVPDGYWRGPIWAPSTMIIVQGLADAGEREFAREIARRFCDMCARSGFAENFDALTGEGLRDPAYTWTSSVFLLLAHEYLLDE